MSNQKGELTWSHSFSLLALLFAYQSGQSFYMALKGCNRKRIHQLITFPRTEISLFWLTKNTILHFTWLGLPQECDHESLLQWHNVYPQLPVFTKNGNFVHYFLLLLLNIPLHTFKSAMQLIGIYFRYLFDHVLTFLVWQTKARDLNR